MQVQFNKVRKVVRIADETGARDFGSKAAAEKFVRDTEMPANVRKLSVMECAYTDKVFVRVWPQKGVTGPELAAELN